MRERSCLQERKRVEAAKEAEIADVLRKSSGKLEAERDRKRRKKKSVDELRTMIAYDGMWEYALRPLQGYVARSCNLDRQVIGLVKHLYVKYPVPDFLYAAVIHDKEHVLDETRPENKHAATFRKWFITVAQGGSFAKLVKGIMTSKEAHTFLQGSAERTIIQNFWWAKMRVAGIPENIIRRLIDKYFEKRSFEDDSDGRMTELIHFYALHHAEMDLRTFDELADFIKWQLVHEPTFRYKGRTVGSMLELSNQWHILLQKARLGQHAEWKPMPLLPWETVVGHEVWVMHELCNNKELMNEGRKQKHCVYSYVESCCSGYTHIFSMRAYLADHDGDKVTWRPETETRRITVEVRDTKDIVQYRGPNNRTPYGDEMAVLRQWASEHGVQWHRNNW